jgi:glycosyltransferase involved in cell wall biosynthesis
MSLAPLRIALLSYRGNPQCGGQGIYIRYLSRELAALGHGVDVWSGQPYPEVNGGVRLCRVPSLDLWNEAQFFRTPTLRELQDPINVYEWMTTMTGAFPEPRTFTWRFVREFRKLPPAQRYDVLHDNQALGSGLSALRSTVPIVTTIHHPITVDRRIALKAAKGIRKRLGLLRWYTFIPMQIRVARELDRIITVSDKARIDIAKEFDIPESRIRVVPCGVDQDIFRPLPGVQRKPDRIITTVSSNTPMKGLNYLLEAFAELRRERPSLTLTVIGRNGHKDTENRLRALNLNGAVRFTGWVTTEEIVTAYAEASVAVVASLYEGFGLPAAEAMACQVPLVSTNAGALPEVVGTDGTAGVLVQPGRSESLARPIRELLDAPQRREAMGVAGRQRVLSLFTWRRAAERTAEIYREAIEGMRASRC